MIQLGIWESTVSSPSASGRSPADKRFLGEVKTYYQAPENNHFERIFYQLTVKGLHKLIYLHRTITEPVRGKDRLKDRPIFCHNFGGLNP